MGTLFTVWQFLWRFEFFERVLPDWRGGGRRVLSDAVSLFPYVSGLIIGVGCGIFSASFSASM